MTDGYPQVFPADMGISEILLRTSYAFFDQSDNDDPQSRVFIKGLSRDELVEISRCRADLQHLAEIGVIPAIQQVVATPNGGHPGYIILDRVPGITLEDIDFRYIDVKTVVQAYTNLCMQLLEARAQHGDLHPANVIFNTDTLTMIAVDFDHLIARSDMNVHALEDFYITILCKDICECLCDLYHLGQYRDLEDYVFNNYWSEALTEAVGREKLEELQWEYGEFWAEEVVGRYTPEIVKALIKRNRAIAIDDGSPKERGHAYINQELLDVLFKGLRDPQSIRLADILSAVTI